MALNNVPVAGQSLNASRNLINTNFLTINTVLTVDHIEYNVPDEGKHKKSTYIQQNYTLPDLGPATAVTESIIFGRDSLEVPGAMSLFLQPSSKIATDKPIEFTYAKKTPNGYTILPSGIWLQWGTTTAHGGGGWISFPQAFPTACLSVQICVRDNPGWHQNFVKVSGAYSTTQFYASSENKAGFSEDCGINFFAIGY